MHDILLLLLVSCISILLGNYLALIIHELGHAFAAIALTGKVATVCLGTSSKESSSIKFKIALLQFEIQKNILLWGKGLCKFQKPESIDKHIFIIAAGPVASFLGGIIGLSLVAGTDIHGSIKLCLFLFALISIVTGLRAALPLTDEVKFDNGKEYPTDGRVILQLVRQKRKAENITLVNDHIVNNRPGMAILLLETMISKGERDPAIYDTLAWQYVGSGDNASAFRNFSKASELAPQQPFYKLNVAFCSILLENYAVAIAIFDEHTHLDGFSAYVFANRGLAKIELGIIDDGLKDIDHALAIDRNEAYAYRSKGIYYLGSGNNNEALLCFEKAKELNEGCYRIGELIEEAQGN